ncbi:hypothetical protein C8D88_11568 [Lentzea atacamensis]|uniref:Uncharacterized protein n=1 Tax=Lentzea atacamensis TaxID=531938 RepID=A0A316HPP7_9PSEU|nr:hypothetical protein C8D88_11568 [Lentzea atacamensis]
MAPAPARAQLSITGDTDFTWRDRLVAPPVWAAGWAQVEQNSKRPVGDPAAAGWKRSDRKGLVTRDGGASQLNLEKRSKYSVSFAMTRSFLAPRLLSFAKRETGGRNWVIAVPWVAIAPSRKAASMNDFVCSG